MTAKTKKKSPAKVITKTAEPSAAPSPEVIGYKAFRADWTCRDFKYEVGQSYQIDGEIKLCSHGFHGVTVPFDAWNYYEGSLTFARVRASAPEFAPDTDEYRDSKFVTARLTIEASLTLPEWIKTQVATVLDLCKTAKGLLAGETKECAAATGDSGHAAATGYSGHAAATGDSGHAAATGYSGHAAATGYSGHAAATGYSGHAAATGDSGHAAATGDSGHAAATGDSGHAAATGYSGHAAATGDSGHAAATGEHSIAASLGVGGTAQGAVGTWLVLAAHKWNGSKYELLFVKTGKVGDNGIKPDTRYRLTWDGTFEQVAP
jgi:hypothetical protein